MSHGGAEGAGIPKEVADFVADQAHDKSASGPGGQRNSLSSFKAASRDGLVASIGDLGSGIQQGEAPSGLTSVRASRDASPATGGQPPMAGVDRSGSTQPNGYREQGPTTTEQGPANEDRQGSARAIFKRIQLAEPGPASSVAPIPGETPPKDDDTAAGGTLRGDTRSTATVRPQDEGPRFGTTRPQSETQSTGSDTPGETTRPITKPTEPQDDIPGHPREGQENARRTETKETQEEQERQDKNADANDSPASLAFESDRAPVYPRPAQPPGFATRINAWVANKMVSRTVPDHPDTAAKRRGKISKYSAKVAHHLSTKAKEYGGLALSTIGGFSLWGLTSGSEQAVGGVAGVITGLLIWGSAKADFLPELLAFKYTAPVIGTTAATATLAELTATGVAPATATEATVAAGGVLIIWGAKDIWNKIIHSRLVKKDSANTDREFLTKLRLGSEGAGGKPGLFKDELTKRENEFKEADLEHKRLQSEHLRFYYEALDDNVRRERLDTMERTAPNRRRILDIQSARWRREAADRLANMKPKKQAYMRTFWQSLTDNQRLAFVHANDDVARQYIGTVWTKLNTAQQELFARAASDENLRQTFERMRPEWMKQAEADIETNNRRIKKQQRKVVLAKGRHDRAIEIQEIVTAGKTPRGKLAYVEEQRQRKGSPDNQPI